MPLYPFAATGHLFVEPTAPEVARYSSSNARQKRVFSQDAYGQKAAAMDGGSTLAGNFCLVAISPL